MDWQRVSMRRSKYANILPMDGNGDGGWCVRTNFTELNAIFNKQLK